MIQKGINPFNELYVTETIHPGKYVDLFSPRLIDFALALFQKGNTVVRGHQGSGKSMLLSLLKPDIRIAYAKERVKFPVPAELRNYIGAGISLRRSGAIDFGQRPIKSDRLENETLLPLFFADFLNYWIADDVLNTLQTLRNALNGELARELNLSLEQDRYDCFARDVSDDACWFGYLEGVNGFHDLQERISHRILKYREFLFFNTPSFDEDIERTKTPVAEPIAQMMASIWDNGILPEQVPLFIRIDEYDHLSGLGLPYDMGKLFQGIINKALGIRDPRIHFRIGTRRHAWTESMHIYGTDHELEKDRDYQLIDIDDILRRKEDSKTWVFPHFAEDVFERRLKTAQSGNLEREVVDIDMVLGSGLTPEEKAKKYAASSGENIISRNDRDLPGDWIDYLTELAHDEPLTAKLGEAWLRQNYTKSVFASTNMEERPWESRGRAYWRKERIQLALMQIAAARTQRMIWSGKDDIYSLSGSNILVFVSVCQRIWRAWDQSIGPSEIRGIGEIAADIQNQGILSASVSWFSKIPEQPYGDSRKRFISTLGTFFRRKLLDDKAMSYPGHNGFSILEDEMLQQNPVTEFLRDAVDYGDLVRVAHTTKEKNRRPRVKFYLNPILSAHFQIPVQHIKEPFYTNIKQVAKWMVEADVSGIDLKDYQPDEPSAKRTDNSASEQLILDLVIKEGEE